MNTALLILLGAVFLWSAIRPHDYFTWILETFPAIIAREILIRRNVVRGRGWVYFIVVAICLAISAAYELLEWRVSVATGSKGDAFLGTQGDIWDTQEDMATALVGAIIAPLILGRLHDRQIDRASRGNR